MQRAERRGQAFKRIMGDKDYDSDPLDRELEALPVALFPTLDRQYRQSIWEERITNAAGGPAAFVMLTVLISWIFSSST